jgi:hypothetical protein
MLSRALTNITRALRGRVGPVGLSLAAAALTAVAFAAVSVAQDDGSGAKGSKGGGNGDVLRVGPGPGGPPAIEDLSEEDQQALDQFRQCMSDQGVEPPPRPEADGDGTFKRRLKPPSEAERAKMEKAFKACEDKLPEGARAMGPHPCGPPPGADGEGAAIPALPPGSGSSQREGTTLPAPQGATS